jgi:single-strand DNA-binding protein|tara:strand:+ start:123 stop:476 length:354 start_codon:yes stop_codon:yes gene_type:complete
MKQITIAGRLTRDAEVKTFEKGSIVSFSVAVDDGYGDKKTTIYFDCSYFRTSVAQYLKKGTPICVSGEFKINESNGKTYLKIKTQELQMMGKATVQDNNSSQSYDQKEQGIDDDIPF